MTDAQLLTPAQCDLIIELDQFIVDCLAHRDDDAKARQGEAQFFA